MGVVDPQLLAKGHALESELRREGREDEANILHSLISIAEQEIEPNRYITTGQAAARLGVSRQTIVNWVNRGLIPGTRMGGRLMLPVEAFERFLPFETLLDALDEEHLPLSPGEAARSVRKDREGWHWRNQEK